MAIDTRSKRASVLGVAIIALTLPLSDGSVDQPDRQHVAFSYAGIAAGAVVTDCFIDEINLVSNAPAESVSLIAENADSVCTITENIDVINTISTDPQDSVNSIAENVDSITELCRV